MKGVFIVKVDGGYMIFPRDVIVLQEDVEAGKFTDGVYADSGWNPIKGILDAPPHQPPPKEDTDVPF